ncbi:MAG: glycosyltransferase family 4 protein [Bacteroidales bacterium]|nr:glycosyltransferase family 4 protein [Bacteroidales bacterium]
MVRNTHKIKVCFFAPAAFPLFKKNYSDVFGGAELQMYLIANKLSENKNYIIDFIVADYGQKKIEKFENITVFKSFKLLQKESIFSKFIKSISYFLLLIKINPDIIITTAAHATVGFTALYSKIFNKKHIHRTAHLNDVNLAWINTNGIVGNIYKYGLYNADKVINQSIEHKNLLSKNHKIEAEVIKNAFIINKYQQTEKKSILWVGRFVNWKNPDLFLKLATEFTDEKFTMICPYSDKNLEEWNKFKQKAYNIKNLNFIDNVPFFEIQKYFNESKLFVNTSESEGYPNTFLQAAAAKTPIISLNVNPDNFLTEYNCGYFCNNDFLKMTEKINYLLNDNSKMQQLGENLRQYLENQHDLNKIVIKFEKIISQCI